MNKWYLICIICVAIGLNGCQQKAQTVDNTQPTETTTETSVAQTESPIEPRWTKFVEYMVDEFFHHLPEDAYIIEPEVFASKLSGGETATILDLRAPEAYEASHVSGAVNMTWGSGFYDVLEAIKLDQPVYLYCSTGQFSGQGLVLLRLLGFESYSIHMGWDYGLSKLEANQLGVTKEATFLEAQNNQLDEDLLEEVQNYLNSIDLEKEEGRGNYFISPNQLNDWIESGEEMIVISVQETLEYKKGWIKGAVNYPYDDHFAHDLYEQSKDVKVVLYDEAGQKSSQALTVMRLLGFSAYMLEGGIGQLEDGPVGWVNQGFTLIK